MKAQTDEPLAKATFAGGCFWCLQPPFDGLKGVRHTTAGYTGGQTASPSYEDVTTGATGHAEAVEVIYDPALISYQELLDVFWKNIDPTQKDGQFADWGNQYRTAIFYHTEEQKQSAEASKTQLEKFQKLNGPIVTEIVPAGPFFPAEEHHQSYYLKNPAHYNAYKEGSGRAEFIRRIWGKGK